LFTRISSWPKWFFYALHNLANLAYVAHIEIHGQRFAAFRADFVRQPLQRVHIAGRDGHSCPSVRQRPG